ncbi:MAG TPA: hypothetical protein VFB59_04105 [Candidatus Saccharimonadales bacterium]|nr:hypothetical protein [Candidatus Saccharimonadales bacterium]
MSELRQSAQELQFPNYSYQEVLDRLGELAPEVQHNRDALADCANFLLNAYGVDNRFFAADDNGIGLVLASALHGEAAKPQGKSVAKQNSSQIIADSFARTLFGRYSIAYPCEDVRSMSNLAPEDTFDLYMRYANARLSGRLQDWVGTNNEFQSLHGGTSDGFTIMVLRIGNSVHTRGIGGAAIAPRGMDRYLADLYANGEAFMREQSADPEDAIPYAFVQTFFGRRHIVIMEPTARILLEPEAIGYQDDGANLDLIKALIKHELTHTKGSLALKDLGHPQEDSYIGKLLEEYRAEVLSGCKLASQYPDIYETIRGVNEYARVTIADIIRSLPYGGGLDKITAYGTLVQQLGLGLTAKLAGLLPEDYISFQSPKSSRDLYEALDRGDLTNTIIENMSDDQLYAFVASKDITPEAKSEVMSWLNGIRMAARS